MRSVAKELALDDVFAEDSEDEGTFYGFSDSEISDQWVSNLSQAPEWTTKRCVWR